MVLILFCKYLLTCKGMLVFFLFVFLMQWKQLTGWWHVLRALYFHCASFVFTVQSPTLKGRVYAAFGCRRTWNPAHLFIRFPHHVVVFFFFKDLEIVEENERFLIKALKRQRAWMLLKKAASGQSSSSVHFSSRRHISQTRDLYLYTSCATKPVGFEKRLPL